MSADNQDDSIIFIDTVLQFHLCIPDPDQLSDWEWATKYKVLLDLLKADRSS